MNAQPMFVEVKDHSLWSKHVRGDDSVVAWLDAVPGGASIVLVVDGVRGDWRKMDDGKDGRSTAGFKPVTEPARSAWHRLQDKRGAVVSFAVADDA